MGDFCFLFAAAFIKIFSSNIAWKHRKWELFSLFFCLSFKQKAKSMIKHCCVDCVHFECYFHWLLSSAVLGHR